MAERLKNTAEAETASDAIDIDHGRRSGDGHVFVLVPQRQDARTRSLGAGAKAGMGEVAAEIDDADDRVLSGLRECHNSAAWRLQASAAGAPHG
jgi:hypothetical protein